MNLDEFFFTTLCYGGDESVLVANKSLVFPDGSDWKPSVAPAVSRMLATADALKGKFACIGEVGMTVSPDNTFRQKLVEQSGVPKRVDFVAHLYLFDAIEFDATRSDLSGFFDPKRTDLDFIVLLQLLNQLRTGYASYLTPLPAGKKDGLFYGEDIPPYQNTENAARSVAFMRTLGWQRPSAIKHCGGCKKNETQRGTNPASG